MIQLHEHDIKEGRKKLKEYLKEMQGSFYSHLFRTIWCADQQNLVRLMQGFGGEVFAFLEYSGQIRRFSFHIEDENENRIYVIDGNIITHPSPFKNKITFELEENFPM